ncbi:MAG: hypothetical protein AB2696_18180, partial [Candidatus Thiodiazotropha sp.]
MSFELMLSLRSSPIYGRSKANALEADYEKYGKQVRSMIPQLKTHNSKLFSTMLISNPSPGDNAGHQRIGRGDPE